MKWNDLEIPDKPYYSDDAVVIYHADCRDILPKLPKVDLVLTDPPYLKEYLWTYSTLSEYAYKLLPEGGWCFAYGAGEHILESLSRMCEYLDYYWVFVLLHNGGYPRMWYKKLMSGYKPIFVFTKGVPRVNPWMSTVHTDSMDKNYHKWGQGIGFSEKIIEMLTEPYNIILDPFLGGGMVSRSAKNLNRKCIGIEIEEKYCEIAARRCSQQVFNLGL